MVYSVQEECYPVASEQQNQGNSYLNDFFRQFFSMFNRHTISFLKTTLRTNNRTVHMQLQR